MLLIRYVSVCNLCTWLFFCYFFFFFFHAISNILPVPFVHHYFVGLCYCAMFVCIVMHTTHEICCKKMIRRQSDTDSNMTVENVMQWYYC